MKKIIAFVIFASFVAIKLTFMAIPVSAQEKVAQDEKSEPEEKSTLVILQDFSQISKKFDSDSGNVRLISLLSPT